MSRANANLFAVFQRQFDKTPDKLALRTSDGLCYAYADLDRESARLAHFLADLGLHVGDRVSAQVEKSPQALFLYLACLRAGFVYHPLNPGYRQTELQFLLHDAEPTALVCDPSSLETISALQLSIDGDRVFTLDGQGEGSLIQHSAHCPPEYGVAELDGDDMACLLYSSGTTGVPKGIVLTHRNLLSNARSLVDCWGFGADDVLLHALPIFHVHGLFVALHCALLSGAELRWLASFDLAQVLLALPECSCMMGVPTYYTRLLAAPEFSRELCSNMRLFVSGSAPLLPSTFQAFEARTGQRILERYGMSETGMNTSNPLRGLRKSGTVGLPLPGVSLRVVGERGEALPSGEIGTIEVQGDNVFPGYWRLPDKTAQDFSDDGFFNTGDQAYIDEDGYVAIVGRAKDMVISGGLNIYPKELELLIDALPGVQESAVIGVPHDDFGEALVAVIVPDAASAPRPSELGVREALKAQVAGFKLPKRVLLMDALPRNSMGKVQKNLLRERYAQLFVAGSEPQAGA